MKILYHKNQPETFATTKEQKMALCSFYCLEGFYYENMKSALCYLKSTLAICALEKNSLCFI